MKYICIYICICIYIYMQTYIYNVYWTMLKHAHLYIHIYKHNANPESVAYNLIYQPFSSSSFFKVENITIGRVHLGYLGSY